MEGYFWRFTQAASGHVAIVMCGVSRVRGGEPWAFVGLAVHPGGFFRWAALEDVRADAAGYGVDAGEAFSAGPRHVRVELGPDCRLDASMAAPAGWPRRAFGALGGAQLVPGLSQYWHPHLFAADVRGGVVAGPETFALDGARAYAEKNWGRGFPDHWWWGQAHDFGDDVSVAFAGGPVRVGPGAPARHRGGRAVGRRGPALPPAGGDGDRRRVLAPARALRHAAGRDRGRGGPGDRPRAHRPAAVRAPRVDRSHHHLAGQLRVRVSRRGRMVYAGECRWRGWSAAAAEREFVSRGRWTGPRPEANGTVGGSGRETGHRPRRSVAGARRRSPQRPPVRRCAAMPGSTIEVVDKGRLIAFSFEDVLSYHGPTSPGGAALRHPKLLERALPLLDPHAPCERREISIETGRSASCSGSPTAIRRTTLVLREGFVTDAFVDLARAERRSAAEERRLGELELELAERVLARPAGEVYVTIGT